MGTLGDVSWGVAWKRGAGSTLPWHPGICAAGGTSDAAMAHNRFGGVAPGVLEVQLVGWHREPSRVSLCCVVAASRLKSGDSPLGHAQRVLLGNIEICDIL